MKTLIKPLAAFAFGLLVASAHAQAAGGKIDGCEFLKIIATKITRARDNGKTERQVVALNNEYFASEAEVAAAPLMKSEIRGITHEIYTNPGLLTVSPEKTGAVVYALCRQEDEEQGYQAPLQ